MGHDSSGLSRATATGGGHDRYGNDRVLAYRETGGGDMLTAEGEHDRDTIKVGTVIEG